MSQDLTLTEFPPVSTAEWEQAIRKDLKEAAPAKNFLSCGGCPSGRVS
jgi:hypothetical protein